MTSLRFYGGVDEIGGNKILVKDKNSIFLDFGMSFSQAKKFLSEFLQPRKCNGILDFVELGLLPWIKGIYREDYLRHCGLPCEDRPAVDGVILSHSHMDHSAYINHLREDIPIYMTLESYVILEALEETSGTSFTDLLNLKRTFHFVPKARGDGFKKLQGKEAKIERDTQVIKPYRRFEIGEVAVMFAPVDHSLPGASAHIIETSEEAMIYTGDLRFHGRRGKDTKKFVKKAKKVSPATMICEGTRINSKENITESDIEKKAIEIISDSKDFVVVDYPLRDLDRLVTFYNVAENTDRTLVVNLKQAYILNQLKTGDYPSLDDVAIYIPRRRWGLIGDSCACFNGEWIPAAEIEKMDPHYIKQDYNKWEQKFLDLENTVTYEDLREEPDQFIFRCDFFELKELIDIKPKKGIYIRSMTEPFDEEMLIDYKKVKNWIKHFNLTLIKGMHSSGHASGPEIIEMIREIEPEKIHPIHTENKESFKTLKEDKIKIINPTIAK